jgi:hypothetical protein
MGTIIYFAGAGGDERLHVHVAETAAEVFDRFNGAHDKPFALTPVDGDGPLYVNPATIAFWRANAEAGSAIRPA